jgi:hypothetical protein
LCIETRTRGRVSASDRTRWGRAMFAKNSLSHILKKVDLLVAEIAQLRASGPHFRILYPFRMPGSTGRLPGQEIYAVFLAD